MASINFFLLYSHIKSTDNKIGERGAKSLSEALKSNITLAKLDLSSEDKNTHTQIAYFHKLSTLFHFL